jgi:hypothetical protein
MQGSWISAADDICLSFSILFYFMVLHVAEPTAEKDGGGGFAEGRGAALHTHGHSFACLYYCSQPGQLWK